MDKIHALAHQIYRMSVSHNPVGDVNVDQNGQFSLVRSEWLDISTSDHACMVVSGGILVENILFAVNVSVLRSLIRSAKVFLLLFLFVCLGSCHMYTWSAVLRPLFTKFLTTAKPFFQPQDHIPSYVCTPKRKGLVRHGSRIGAVFEHS